MSISKPARSGRWGAGWEPANPHQMGFFLTFLTFRTCSSPRVQARVHAYARGRADARARAPLPHLTLGRLGRLGTRPCHQGFRLPNLCPTSSRLGT